MRHYLAVLLRGNSIRSGTADSVKWDGCISFDPSILEINGIVNICKRLQQYMNTFTYTTKYPVYEEVLDTYVEKWETRIRAHPMPITAYCPSFPHVFGIVQYIQLLNNH